MATQRNTNVGQLGQLATANATSNQLEKLDTSTLANVNLGAVGNVHITGGFNNQVLTTNGNGV